MNFFIFGIVPHVFIFLVLERVKNCCYGACDENPRRGVARKFSAGEIFFQFAKRGTIFGDLQKSLEEKPGKIEVFSSFAVWHKPCDSLRRSPEALQKRREIMKKSFSQKVARVFEIIGYLWLVPGILGLIFPLLGLIGSLMSLTFSSFLILMLPFLAFGLGVKLLVGYYRHSRGTLDEEKIRPLWIGTFLFNLVPFVPSFYLFCESYLKRQNRTYPQVDDSPFVFFGLLISWWGIAVLLSICAYFKEAASQKYL